MSSLADRIAARAPDRKSGLDRWIDSLDPDDRKAVDDLAVNPDWSNLRIVEFLKSEDVAVGKDAVAAWRARHGFRR